MNRALMEAIRMDRFEDIYGELHRGELSCEEAAVILGCEPRGIFTGCGRALRMSIWSG